MYNSVDLTKPFFLFSVVFLLFCFAAATQLLLFTSLYMVGNVHVCSHWLELFLHHSKWPEFIAGLISSFVLVTLQGVLRVITQVFEVPKLNRQANY